MSTSKIKVKYGHIEVEFEGSEEFLKLELPKFLESIAALNPSVAGGNPNPAGTAGSREYSGQQLSTNTIASKLGSKTGPDLVLAAACRLMLFGGKATFSRKDLTSERKGGGDKICSEFGSSSRNSRVIARVAAVDKVNRHQSILRGGN